MKILTVKLGCDLNIGDRVTMDNPKAVKLTDDVLSMQFMTQNKGLVNTLIKLMNDDVNTFSFMVYDNKPERSEQAGVTLVTKLTGLNLCKKMIKLKFKVLSRNPIITDDMFKNDTITLEKWKKEHKLNK